MGEHPWKLRSPPEHLRDLTKKQLRAMVLAAVAHGNDPQMTSPFLHVSASLVAVRKLIGERRWLYSNWFVRWRRDCVGDAHINFSDKLAWGWLLAEWDDDPDFLIECLQKGSLLIAVRAAYS